MFLSGLTLSVRPLGWPAVTSTNQPWTRWWWLGSTVDPLNLTHQLEDFAQASLGGVEICPIYAPTFAAHSKGDQLVSGETFTWLDKHFQVTP